MPASLFEPRRAFQFYVAFLLILLTCLGLLWRKGLQVETNILALLPPTEQDPVIADAVDRLTESLGGRLVFVVGHEDAERARAAARRVEQTLVESVLFAEVSGHMDSNRERAWFETYFPYRYQLLSQQARAALGQGNGDWLTGQAEQTLYSPMSALYSRVLDEDPLLLFAAFVQGLPKPPGDLKLRQGWLSVNREGQHYIVITATSNQETFSRRDQEAAIGLLDQMGADLLAAEPKLTFTYTGLLRYAAAGAETAEREVTVIGTGSTLGVILLFLLVFRRPRPLLLGLLPIATGLLAATVVCFTVFGKLHLMTLGFGAGLIGISIDYTFHYFCERLNETEADPSGALTQILPAICLGALTSIMGYLGLMVAPFPGLRQMALFSAVGLLGAFATVVLAFPRLAAGPMGGSAGLLVPVQAYLKLWQGLPRRGVGLLLLLLLPLVVMGIQRLHNLDDIRALQEPDPELREQEVFISTLAGSVDTSRFLLVEGRDGEQILQRQEALAADLQDMQAGGGLRYFQGVHQLIPSRARQMENRQLLRQNFLGADSPLDAYMENLGFEDEITRTAKRALEGEPESYLELDSWLKDPVSRGLRSMWLGETDRGAAAVVILGGLTDEQGIQALAARHEGVAYVDKVAEISSLMSRYRQLSIKLVGGAYLLILLLLLWRRGLWGGFLVVLPALLAATGTLAIFGWLQIPVSLFNYLALLLVLGIGIDYTIFFAESKGDSQRTMLAILLSALTTVMAFGLLALSEVAVLYSFGLTVLFGIGLAWLFAPMALWGKS